MSSFRVTSEVSGETSFVQPTGELDLSTAEILAKEIESSIAKPGTSKIVIDMSGVPFVDSTGLRILIEGGEKAAQRSLEFSLERPSPQFARLIELTKTAGVLNID